jgi:hypothetical protein
LLGLLVRLLGLLHLLACNLELPKLLRVLLLGRHHLLNLLDAPLRSFGLLELLRIPLRRLHLASLFSGSLGSGVLVASAFVSVCRRHQQPTAQYQKASGT